MGRNKFGGNKQKAMENGSSDKNVIYKTEDDQFYAVVIKSLGNSNFQVADSQNNLFIAHVRGKMKGSAKRRYFIHNNDILLVQKRSFQTSQNICDILQIYNNQQYQYIHSYNSLNNVYLQHTQIHLTNNIQQQNVTYNNHNNSYTLNNQNNYYNDNHNDIDLLFI